MRRYLVVPAIALAASLLASCAGAGSAGRQAQVAKSPTASAPAPAPRLADPVLILANRDGAVSVRTANGAVAFRAQFGVAAPDSSTVVQAQPIDTGTRVVASDPLTGVPRWSHDVVGTRKVRVVAPGGKFVALIDSTLTVASSPRTSTVIDIATAEGTRALRLDGNLDPEAFSVNGRYLYTLAFLPPMNPTRYSVRRIDLTTNRIEAVPDRNGHVRSPMPGYSRTQLMSPDGRQLYTFYASAEPIHVGGDTYHAWVHVLNLAEGWAYCLDLDEKIGVSGNVNAGLAVSPDGSRLFVSDSVATALAVVDTKTLRVIRTRFLPTLANENESAILATDGRTVFARDGLGGLSAIDAHTLASKSVSISGASGIGALRVDGSGAVLYMLTQEGLLVVDPRGRVVHRWPSPGDATSIDPAVTIPGSGAYQCAC